MQGEHADWNRRAATGPTSAMQPRSKQRARTGYAACGDAIATCEVLLVDGVVRTLSMKWGARTVARQVMSPLDRINMG